MSRRKFKPKPKALPHKATKRKKAAATEAAPADTATTATATAAPPAEASTNGISNGTAPSTNGHHASNGHAANGMTDAERQDLLDKIADKAKQLGEARSYAKARKSDYKAAKSHLDELSIELEDLAKQANVDMPLIAYAKRNGAASGTTEPLPVQDESWRDEKISGIPQGTLEILNANNLHDWGQYEDFLANGRTAREFKGIGEAANDKLENARIAFREKWDGERARRAAEAAQVVKDVAAATDPAAPKWRELAIDLISIDKKTKAVLKGMGCETAGQAIDKLESSAELILELGAKRAEKLRRHLGKMQDAETKAAPAPENTANGETMVTLYETPPAWHGASIDTLDIPGPQAALLKRRGVETVGALALILDAAGDPLWTEISENDRGNLFQLVKAAREAAEAEPAAASTTEPSWKALSIATLELDDPKTIGILEEAQVGTLGSLHELLTSAEPEPLAWLKKLGPKRTRALIALVDDAAAHDEAPAATEVEKAGAAS